MAKSAKKAAKKVVKKAKPAPKPKKAAKPAAKKTPAKAAKKVVKPAPAKKEVVKKEVVVAPVAKRTEKKQAPAPAPKPQLNLNIFPALTQRPIAHKPAKSSMPEDKTRYSDEELKEFETLILNKLEKSREEFRILKETLNRNNDAGTDATSGGNTKVLEDGAETAEKENLSQLASRQLKYITNLENALVRIKNGTYGICTVTGKLIPKERLIAVPHTTQSIEAKMMQQD
jgi:RNA polymerase-binding transcription factor DksA